MKYLFLLFTLAQIFNSLAQDVSSIKKFPFQVLYAENTKNKAGLSLKSLDLVSSDDALTVGEGGTLSLIHYTGFPIEVNDDTTIVIKNLKDLLEGTSSNKKNKQKITYSPFPELDRLFITDSRLARKKTGLTTGACHDCGSGLEILYPPNFSMGGLYFKDDLCVTWMPNKSKSYRVVIETMFEDPVDTVLVSNNELHFNNQEFKRLMGEESYLVAVIQDLENVNLTRGILIKKYQLNSLEFPYPCDLKKPTFALMAGLYIETLPNNYLIEAEKYFVLATELSDLPFYKEMLANFKKRTER